MPIKYNIIKLVEDKCAESEAKGKAESILALLEELSPVPENMQDQILTQTDFDILMWWLKCAAKAESLDEWKRLVDWTEEVKE